MLGAMCAGRGSRVILGQHDVVRRLLPQLRAGVYVGKNIFLTDFSSPDVAQHYRVLKEREFGLVHLDEEGAVYQGNEQETWRRALLMRLDPRVLSADDEICVWGTFQSSIYRGLDPPPLARVTATGHPRFDLLREHYRWFYHDDVESLHTRYGNDFVLFNSTFTAAQPKLGPDYIFSQACGYSPEDESARHRFLATWSHQQRILPRVVALLERVRRETPERMIVIRPHPNEDLRCYTAMFRGIANVAVVHQGSAVPWLLAAGSVLHCGCTTAIEATMAGKRVVLFRPEEQPVAEPALAVAFGVSCTTDDEVLHALASPQAQPERDDKWSHELIANLTGNIDSFAAVCDAITRVQSSRQDGVSPGAMDLRARQSARMVNDLGRSVARRLSPPRAQLARARRTFFPKLDRTLIRRKLAVIATHQGLHIKATFLGNMLVVLERDD